jgi:hypothetical protein
MLPHSSSGKWREFEKKALEIRRFAGVGPADRLDPVELAALLNLKVTTLSELDHLSEETRDHLMGSDNWSGGVTQPLPDGSRVIILNDRHSPERRAATLMEEICHSLLGHEPSSISVKSGRTYNRMIEEEAYAVGAASLLPYRAIVESLSRGDSVGRMAKRYGVTRSLVEYRIRVLDLWKV